MSNALIVSVLVIYFVVLIAISYLTSRKADNDSFFRGERKSPWYIVSFGMIGASLSGVTFISIPGWVGNETNQFSYMQAVFGYLVGYFIVAYVLLPLYYRLNLTSIYEYLKLRFGFWSYKTGASFFLLSRIIGASVRLLLVANVLQSVLFDEWGIRFEFTVVISVLLIWLYTNRGGIKTIVWTDTLQTAFMLGSVLLTVWFIADALDLKESGGMVKAVSISGYSKIFFFNDINSSNHFLKHFLGGIFITIGMTGLDQDMMQKNLSCKNIKEAQKNMISMAVILVVVNLIFLALGALLYLYATKNGINFAKPDLLFSSVALHSSAGPIIGVLFLLGLIAAAYSSADSALTSLTTSFSIDFLGVNDSGFEEDKKESTRKIVHVIMSAVIILTVILLKNTTEDSAIGLLMKFAGFTYGPLIGMFFFGILSKRKMKDVIIPFVCLFSILSTIALWYFSAGAPGGEEVFLTDRAGKVQLGIFGEYKFGFEIILMNALITFGSLFLLSSKDDSLSAGVTKIKNS
ncbi:MAG: sodium:solute symporter [Flavobacteriales bacterium]|nr:sodium:solute symporter [Flavobacteriales bacterium]